MKTPTHPGFLFQPMRMAPVLVFVLGFVIMPFSALYSHIVDYIEYGRLYATSGYAYSTNNSTARPMAGLAGAIGIGSMNEFGIEVNCGKWKNTQYNEDGSIQKTRRENHWHILLNYGHYIPLRKTPIAFHFGGGLGIGAINSGIPMTDAMREALKDPYWENRGDGEDDNSNTLNFPGSNGLAFIAAATVGFVVKSADNRYDIGISYRCLWEESLRYIRYYSYDKAQHKLYDERSYRVKGDLIHMVLVNFSIRF